MDSQKKREVKLFTFFKQGHQVNWTLRLLGAHLFVEGAPSISLRAWGTSSQQPLGTVFSFLLVLPLPPVRSLAASWPEGCLSNSHSALSPRPIWFQWLNFYLSFNSEIIICFLLVPPFLLSFRRLFIYFFTNFPLRMSIVMDHTGRGGGCADRDVARHA